MQIIQLHQIVKKYKKRTVLGPIDLAIKSGSAVAIFGDNGAGKTTLCEIISNAKKPTSGKITYSFNPEQIPFLIGINFQDQKYPNTLTVKEMVNFYYRLYHKQIDQKHFEKMIQRFKIRPLFNHKVNVLSGGQRQRVNLFLALFHKPKIFIGDEISTGLDIKTKLEIIQFLKEQVKANNITLILVSHNWEEIQALCKRIIFISKGKIIDDQTIQNILKKHENLLAYYLEKTNHIKEINSA